MNQLQAWKQRRIISAALLFVSLLIALWCACRPEFKKEALCFLATSVGHLWCLWYANERARYWQAFARSSR